MTIDELRAFGLVDPELLRGVIEDARRQMEPKAVVVAELDAVAR